MVSVCKNLRHLKASLGLLNNHKQNRLKRKNHLHQVGKNENFHVYICVLLALRHTGLFRPLEWVNQCILAHALLESIQRPLVFIWRKCSLYQKEASWGFCDQGLKCALSVGIKSYQRGEIIEMKKKVCSSKAEFYTTSITFRMTPVSECSSALGLCDCFVVFLLVCICVCVLGGDSAKRNNHVR